MNSQRFIFPVLVILVALASAWWWSRQVPYLLTLTPMSQEQVLHSALGGDFRMFWSAGHVAAKDDASKAYDRAAIAAQEPMRQLRPDQGIAVPLMYPPTILPVLSLFGRQPFPEAWLLYEGASLALLLLGVVAAFPRQVWAVPVALGFGGVWLTLDFGQNTVILTALYLLVLASAPLKEGRMGVLLALATFKPHLGAVMPLWLLLRRQWLAVLVAGGTTALMFAVTYYAYGPEILQDYRNGLQFAFERLEAFKQVRPETMISVYACLRQWGVSSQIAFIAQGVVALIALWGLVSCSRNAIDAQKPFAAAILAALLIMPHSYVYDLVLLLIPLLVFIRCAGERGWMLRDAEVILPMYFVPFYAADLNAVTRLPIVPILLLWSMYHVVHLAKVRD